MRREEINIRDPFVLTRNGQYYLYGTRGATCWGPADGFDVYVSRDLENWDGPFECFHNDGTFWADRNYWAPEVHEYHGKLYMLASFKREDLCRGTAILTADNPLGPFVPHSDGRVTPSNWECLDGTLYVSPDDKPYLVFAHEWVQVGDGEICAMPLSDDLSRAIGEPKLLFHASEAEWARLVHHRSSGRDGYVTDGPSMWRTEDGTLLCLWASFSDEGYTEGVAVSDNGDITGHFTQVEPLFRRDGGHGMVFRALDGMDISASRPNTPQALSALTGGNLALLADSLGNTLQPVAISMRPQIRQAITTLREHGARAAQMTGSGSAVFGVFATAAAARTAFAALSRRYPHCYLTQTL